MSNRTYTVYVSLAGISMPKTENENITEENLNTYLQIIRDAQQNLENTKTNNVRYKEYEKLLKILKTCYEARLLLEQLSNADSKAIKNGIIKDAKDKEKLFNFISNDSYLELEELDLTKDKKNAGALKNIHVDLPDLIQNAFNISKQKHLSSKMSRKEEHYDTAEELRQIGLQFSALDSINSKKQQGTTYG